MIFLAGRRPARFFQSCSVLMVNIMYFAGRRPARFFLTLVGCLFPGFSGTGYFFSMAFLAPLLWSAPVSRLRGTQLCPPGHTRHRLGTDPARPTWPARAPRPVCERRDGCPGARLAARRSATLRPYRSVRVDACIRAGQRGTWEGVMTDLLHPRANPDTSRRQSGMDRRPAGVVDVAHAVS